MAFLFDLITNKIKTSVRRIIAFGTILVSFTIVIFKPSLIWQLLTILNISGHGAVDISSAQVLGLTKATLIKPIYAFFQMIFGPAIAPTYSMSVGVIFILITIISLLLLYKIWKVDSHLFLRMLFSVIIPFFMIYYFFQSLSLPGATQLEPKHGMLLFPLLIYLVIKSHKYVSPLVSYIFIGLVFSAQLMGLQQLKQKRNPDWNYIAKMVNESLQKNNNSFLLMDGRSSGIYEFYSQNYSSNSPIAFTWEPMETLEIKYHNKSRIVLLLNDYKSYTPLSLKQNWNAGAGSQDRFDRLQHILKKLNQDYSLTSSYVNYPSFLYVLDQKENSNDIQSFGVWKHHLKDLRLPIEMGNSKVLSSVLVNQSETIRAKNDSLVIFNLENIRSNISNGDTIGIIESELDKNFLVYGDNIWDVFSEYHQELPTDSSIIYSWQHLPLVSGSIQYPGSFFSHRANIFSIDLPKKQNQFFVTNVSENAKIRIWITD